MLPSRRHFLTGAAAGAVASSSRPVAAQSRAMASQTSPVCNTEFLERAFVHGREYFVLRSGRIRVIAQADRVDNAPAFLWLAFDAHNNRQTRRKQNAFNFGGGAGFVRSALQVVLGGFPFTALGHETETRWVVVDGIPAVEAAWWAGGLLVAEHIFALQDAGAFMRRITVSSRNLGGTEDVTLRLSLPEGATTVRDGCLVQENGPARLLLGFSGPAPGKLRAPESTLEIGPLTIPVGGAVSVDTWFAVEIDGDRQAPPDIGASIRQTSAAWAPASNIRTEDATVRELFDKARYGLVAMIADDGTMDAGIFEYGAQWVRDTSNTLLGLIHAGAFETARVGLAHVLRGMVDDGGRTVVAGSFDDPDREQFDQAGELLHALRAYVDWTGDDSLVREYRTKLLAMVERPLLPQFRHESGMVHNRREYWERTLDDGFELAYQTYLTLGLREAASLAPALGVPERAAEFRREAERTLSAMLSHPSLALVEQGRLIKRRSLSGAWVREIQFPPYAEDVPAKTERVHRTEPDASMALPIALGLVDPRSSLARNTLDELEKLWNARWFGGGYERYDSSAQPDQPGPWTFATCFILRAQHDAALYDRSRRTMEWLNTVQGGRTGAWFEEIPVVRSQSATAGILPWNSGEVALFVVRHLLGVRFADGELTLRPALHPGSPPVHADLRFRNGRLALDFPGAGPFQSALVNGRRVEVGADGTVRLGAGFESGSVSFHA